MLFLAATDFSTRSNRALRQVGLLAQSGSAEIHIVHVVDDDQPEELVRLEMREAERLLREQVSSMPELQRTQPHPMVVAGAPFHGILRVAKEIQPDLIVMGSHRKKFLLDIFVGTTIERVIRKGAFPVLMVNFEAQHQYERVIAPTDMSDVSADAFRVALLTGLIGDKGATLLHALVAPAKGRMFIAGLDQASIDSYVASERGRIMEELTTFLNAHGLQHIRWSLRVEEGAPMEIISRAMPELRPDLLVMGTHRRSAVLKALIGSITEEALRSLDVDILAVPPVKR